MALIKCPECGREGVSDKARVCPGCGYPLSNQNVNIENTPQSSSAQYDNTVQNNSKDKNKFIPFIVVGCVVLFFGGIYYFSTRCEYDGCSNKKMSGYSYCSYHYNKIMDAYDSYNSYTSSSYDSYDSRSKYDLKISDVEVSTNSASTHCTGTITNKGDKSFKFVQVKGSFKDSNGNTIDTGSTYAVGSEGLEPGESSTFYISCDQNYDIETCTVTVYDFE